MREMSGAFKEMLLPREIFPTTMACYSRVACLREYGYEFYITLKSSTMESNDKKNMYCILGLFRVRKLFLFSLLSRHKNIYYRKFLLETIADSPGSICEFFSQNVPVRPSLKSFFSLEIVPITICLRRNILC